MFLHQNYGAGGGNGSIVVGMFVCLCLGEFFVPTRTDLAVNSLTAMGGHDRPLYNELLW
jgi:hypothetical protein